MGVYIKGMEMPKDGTCNNCQMAHYHHADDTWSCNVRLVEHDGFMVYAPLIDRNTDGNFIRPADCPLIEVAEPHGRLIDADKLKQWFFRPYSNEKSYVNLDVAKAIEHAPTVIESEVEE